MKPAPLLRFLGIAGIVVLAFSRWFTFFGSIGDSPRHDFATKSEQAAYDQGWQHAEEHVKLERRLFIVNSRVVFGTLLVLSIVAIIVSDRIGRSDKPNQLPDPTSPTVTPPAGARGAPSVAADH